MLDKLVDGVLGGTAWGVGLLVAGAAVLITAPRAKPLAKSVIKGYLTTTQQVREWAAETSEQFQDIYAEAMHEFQVESQGETDADVTVITATPEEVPAPQPRPRRRSRAAAAPAQ